MEARSRIVHGFSNVWQRGVNEGEAVFVFTRESGTRNLQYNDIQSTWAKGAKDLAELKSGDTVLLIPPRSLTGESVKARVNNSVGTRSYEVVTEDGARYRRNRRHLRKTRESYNRSTLTRNLSLTERLVPHGRSQKASPSKQTERAAVAPAVSEQQEAVVPAVCEQQGACHDPVTLQGQSESSSQPIAVCGFPKTTRSGRVVKMPQYLKDFLTEK